MTVLNEKGVLITTYSSKYYDSNMKEVVNKLFGKQVDYNVKKQKRINGIN